MAHYFRRNYPAEPIGGHGTIQKNINYPEMAMETGIEGLVIVNAYVDKEGHVIETSVLMGVPNTGLNEAAEDAIRRTRFFPAGKRGRKVGAWMVIFVNFKLDKKSKLKINREST